MSPMIKSIDTGLYSLSRLGFSSLQYLYSIISVKLDLVPANTKNMVLDLFVHGQSAISRILGGPIMSHYEVGCNNGGGCGNFSKVQRLVAKWIGTRKRLFSVLFAEQVGF